MKNRLGNGLKLVLWASFFFSSIPCFAQITGVAEARTLYPDASAVYLNKSQEYKIFVENTKLTGVCTMREQIFINKESGLSFQKESIPSNSFVVASDIKAFTFVPNNKKYEKKEVQKIDLNNDLGRNSFYDDQKSYDFVYPSVQPGAVLDLTYQLKYVEPRFMGTHYWLDFVPCLKNELVISVQKNITIAYKLFNCENKNIVFTKEEKKNETIYRWTFQSDGSGIYYDDAPNFRYYEPHLVFYVTNYMVDGKNVELLGKPMNLYKWYSDLQKNLNQTEDLKLKQITDSLVANTTSEAEKVNKIFYWVQDNISYVAFEDGLGGFIPRDAGLVCTRKFGDCKDMASIINEMLRFANVKSYLTWIGSRDIPYTYTDVPTPSVDNHMITSYLDKNGVWNFLDATGKHAPQDLYTSFIQGKQALIGVSADSFLIVTVPIKDASVSQTIDSITIDIKDNFVNGKGKAVLSGYDQLEYIYATEHLNVDEKEVFFKGYFAKGSNKVSFSDINQSPFDRTKPLTIHYKFSVPDYARKNQNELYINLNMDLGLGVEQVPASRKVPLNIKHKTKKIVVTILNVPPGYKPEFIPENKRYENDVAGFSSEYTFKNNQIILKNEIYFNILMLEVADFDKYNKVLSELIKSNKQAVSLIKQ
ncbi:MAG: DUF3857 domain-containing protein [Bacteroidetes bacterium]|nr:DUF3857 domain-containing protein [Bacteroidota bacterium]